MEQEVHPVFDCWIFFLLIFVTCIEKIGLLCFDPSVTVSWLCAQAERKREEMTAAIAKEREEMQKIRAGYVRNNF